MPWKCNACGETYPQNGPPETCECGDDDFSIADGSADKSSEESVEGEFDSNHDSFQEINPFAGISEDALNPFAGIPKDAFDPLAGIPEDAFDPLAGIPEDAFDPLAGIPENAFDPLAGIPEDAFDPLAGIPEDAFDPLAGIPEDAFDPLAAIPEGVLLPFAEVDVVVQNYEIATASILNSIADDFDDYNQVPETDHEFAEKPEADYQKNRDYEWGYVEWVNSCVLMSSYLVDKYIEETGIGPTVNELKRRRWILALTLSLLNSL